MKNPAMLARRQAPEFSSLSGRCATPVTLVLTRSVPLVRSSVGIVPVSPNWFSAWRNFSPKLVETPIVGGKNKVVSGEDFLTPIHLRLVNMTVEDILCAGDECLYSCPCAVLNLVGLREATGSLQSFRFIAVEHRTTCPAAVLASKNKRPWSR